MPGLKRSKSSNDLVSMEVKNDLPYGRSSSLDSAITHCTPRFPKDNVIFPDYRGAKELFVQYPATQALERNLSKKWSQPDHEPTLSLLFAQSSVFSHVGQCPTSQPRRIRPALDEATTRMTRLQVSASSWKAGPKSAHLAERLVQREYKSRRELLAHIFFKESTPLLKNLFFFKFSDYNSLLRY